MVMKRIVRLTESDLVNVIKKVIKEQGLSGGLMGVKFRAEGTIEGDMVMSFPVIGMKYVDGDYEMNIYDETNKKSLYVWNFEGPITDDSNKVIYKDSFFKNISKNNAEKIIRMFKIPYVTT